MGEGREGRNKKNPCGTLCNLAADYLFRLKEALSNISQTNLPQIGHFIFI